MTIIKSCTSSNRVFKQKKSEEFVSQPLMAETVLTMEETLHLPVCVQKYLDYSGAIGKSKPQNVCFEFDGRKIAASGKTIWHYPEGDFTYGVFTLKSIKYNVLR